MHFIIGKLIVGTLYHHFVVESPSFLSFKSRLKKVDLSRHCSGRVLASM